MIIKAVHRRHSLRMKGYDYSNEGAYFVTITTYRKECLFGEVINNQLRLHLFGEIVFEQWSRLNQRFSPSYFPKFVVMPNHVHGIIHLVRGAGEESQNQRAQIPPQRPYTHPHVAPGSLGAIVRAHKTAVSFRINAIRGITNPLVWQRNYYDHIIRNEKEYQFVWDYVEANPDTWIDDQLIQQASPDFHLN